ncbi:hypothetical protein MHH52_00485 [Paenibacillus sp. FSL K6-0276]|uniref:hypothetical protein n=1 Tax=Paenibacillus sp. FSL K6-0276 TaxID=2921450 RepID=UPI0030ECFB2D
MNLLELKDMLCIDRLRVHDKLPTIYMPNEIFEDITNNVTGSSLFVSSVYACYYLDTFLYRYAIYGKNELTLKVPIRKQLLGFSGKSTFLDPIIKKGGILNLMGYTKPDSNYPIQWYLNEDRLVIFDYLKDRSIDEENNIDYGYYYSEIVKNTPPRTTISYPIKAFDRLHVSSDGEESKWGTFDDISQTHGIEVETFLKCMSNKELGVEGFYLYSLIKHKYDFYKGYWNISLEKLIEVSGMKPTRMKKVLHTLRQYEMVDVLPMPWVIDRPHNVSTKANGYRAYKAEFFSVTKKQVEKPIKINWATCQERYSYAIIEPQSEKVSFDEYEDLVLPF